MEYSSLGTVCYLEGNFYTDSWELVFSPTSALEKDTFLNYINQLETEYGRQLTDAEVLSLEIS